MGLDITAYSHLTAIGEHEKDPESNEGEPGGEHDWCYHEGHHTAFAYKGFEASLAGFPILAERTVGGSTFLFCGCYAETSDTKKARLHSGYGGHSRFRERLRTTFDANYRSFHGSDAASVEHGPWVGLTPSDPFYELINFADNEGTISSLAAAELLVDFDTHRDAFFLKYGGKWDGTTEHYDSFRKACALAAQNGLIEYH